MLVLPPLRKAMKLYSNLSYKGNFYDSSTVYCFWPYGTILYLLWWLGCLFNDANKTETGSPFNVILVFCKNEGLWSFHFEFYAMRSNTLFSGDLKTRHWKNIRNHTILQHFKLKLPYWVWACCKQFWSWPPTQCASFVHLSIVRIKAKENTRHS